MLQQLESRLVAGRIGQRRFRPVSRYWDRIDRPEQLLARLPEAMRVLTDPAETGAVTLACRRTCRPRRSTIPVEFFEKRVWHVAADRRPTGRAAEARVELIRAARRPLIVAGGGVIYSEATEALDAFVERDRHPGGRDAGGEGRAAVRSSAARWARSA